MRQFVYRQERSSTAPVQPVPGYRFHLLQHPGAALTLLSVMARSWGVAATMKQLLKLATFSRMLYVVTGPNAVASYGGITLSRCRYYPVDRGAAVIGPVETTADCRGKGLATWGLIMAMEQLTRTGRRTFYIDTSEGNVAMQTVIARCGFGDPIACYERDERMYR